MESSAQKISILFAEDVQTNRMLIEIILKRAGYSAVICADGQEALELANTQKFDIILMDIQMPVMDGIEAAKRIKTETINKDTPIIALTASDTKQELTACFEAGIDDHLAKSSKHDILLRKIEKYTRQAQAARNADFGGDIFSILEKDGSYEKTIERFVNELPARIRDIQESFEKGNLHELANQIHSLKGMGGFAGFPIYTVKAAELEELLRTNQLDKVRRQINELISLCERTKPLPQDSKN